MVKKSPVASGLILSIVVPAYNAEGQLERFFTSLQRQTLPRSHFEVLIVDGGSTDKTRAIAEKYHARIIHNPLKLAEPGVVLGFEKAKGELVMVLATDNIFKDNTALQIMVDIFKDKSIVGAFPKHDTAPDDSMFSRYINTFTDPFTHFVYGKAANARTFHELYKTIKHTDVYDIYDYRSSSVMPLIAIAQGLTVRKSALMNRAEDRFDDVLSLYKLIKHGKLLAYVHSVSLYHYTVKNLADFIRKQRRSAENALKRENSGITQRSSYLTTGQKARMVLFFPYALTIVLPLLQSLMQAARTREKTWLMHWYISFVAAIILIATTLSI